LEKASVETHAFQDSGHTDEFLEQQYGIKPKDNTEFLNELENYLKSPPLYEFQNRIKDTPTKTWLELNKTVVDVLHPKPKEEVTADPAKQRIILTVDLTDFRDLLINIRAKIQDSIVKLNQIWNEKNERKD
jgi:hypothetical protein